MIPRPRSSLPPKLCSPIWRASAHLVSHDAEDRPVYGGTPADFAVVQAIQEMKARGLRVTFYPFLLMDVPPGNTLSNPYSANAATPGQPAFPWRGRITCSPAAGFVGSVDKTGTAATQVSALFGAATTGNFSGRPGPSAIFSNRAFSAHPRMTARSFRRIPIFRRASAPNGPRFIEGKTRGRPKPPSCFECGVGQMLAVISGNGRGRAAGLPGADHTSGLWVRTPGNRKKSVSFVATTASRARA